MTARGRDVWPWWANPLTLVSVVICLVIWGSLESVCARAWRLRALPPWGRVQRVLDAICRVYEADHCRAACRFWHGDEA